MFAPYATMFKLPLLGWDVGYRDPGDPTPVRTMVRCVNCEAEYPMSDILRGELEEETCPACEMTSQTFYKGKPHQRVPER